MIEIGLGHYLSLGAIIFFPLKLNAEEMDSISQQIQALQQDIIQSKKNSFRSGGTYLLVNILNMLIRCLNSRNITRCIKTMWMC